MENRPPTIKELFPHLNPNELKEAEGNMGLYLKLVLRIFDRLESDTHPQTDQLISSTGTVGCTPPQSEISN